MDDVYNNYDEALKAVARDGCALQRVAPKLKANRAIVLAAVTQNGCALEFVAPKWKADPAIVLAAVKQWAGALTHAAKKCKSDVKYAKLVLEVSDQKIANLSFACLSPRLQHNSKLVRWALENKTLQWSDLPMDLKRNRAFATWAPPLAS